MKIRLGSKLFENDVYVAPIEDDMLLGIDLMKKWEVAINIRDATFAFKDEQLAMVVDNDSDVVRVARVTVRKKVVIPPNTVKLVLCSLDQSLGDYLLEPSPNLKVLVPRILYGKHKEPRVCLVNPTDNFLQLKRDTCIGKAEEISAAVADYEMGTESKEVDDQGEGEPEPGDVPEHLKDLLHRSAEYLDKSQVLDLTRLLIEHQDVFARDDFDLGSFTTIEHKIDTGDSKPIKQRFRRTPVCFASEEEANLQKMIKAKVVQPSISEWASAPVLVRKRDGSVRWCVDYRALNAVTSKDVFPLPIVDDCIDTLAGNRWFSKLDANSAYWQVKIAEEDRKKTAFMTKYGLFEFVSMPFGLCNAPATYSRVMNLVLRGLTWNIVRVFIVGQG